MRCERMKCLLLLVAVVAGCATTRADADRKVEHAHDRTARSFVIAKHGYMSEHGLTALAVEMRTIEPYGGGGDDQTPVAKPVPADAGFTAGEQLVDAGDGKLGIVTPMTECSCECRPNATYDVATNAKGEIVVLRLSARQHVETVKLSGSCGEGCGTQPPPIPGSLIALPVSDPALVRIVDVVYDEYTVDVTCEHPIPVP